MAGGEEVGLAMAGLCLPACAPEAGRTGEPRPRGLMLKLNWPENPVPVWAAAPGQPGAMPTTERPQCPGRDECTGQGLPDGDFCRLLLWEEGVMEQLLTDSKSGSSVVGWL